VRLPSLCAVESFSGNSRDCRRVTRTEIELHVKQEVLPALFVIGTIVSYDIAYDIAQIATWNESRSDEG